MNLGPAFTISQLEYYAMIAEVDLEVEVLAAMHWLRDRRFGWDGSCASYRHERGFGVVLKLEHATINIGIEYGTWVMDLAIRHIDIDQAALPVGLVLSMLQLGVGLVPTAIHVYTRQHLANGLCKLHELLDYYPGLLEADKSTYQKHERLMIEACAARNGRDVEGDSLGIYRDATKANPGVS